MQASNAAHPSVSYPDRQRTSVLASLRRSARSQLLLRSTPQSGGLQGVRCNKSLTTMEWKKKEIASFYKDRCSSQKRDRESSPTLDRQQPGLPLSLSS